jgi:hypothetical protein
MAQRSELQLLDYNAIKQEAQELAHKTGQAFLDTYYDGHDAGMCGFAWVNIRPANKGNTKAGREERCVLRAMGFELDWTGKEFQWWNPSGLGCQNVYAKMRGAREAAKVLQGYGFNAYAGWRLD